ncbi:serine/threonine-protein kinase [Actinomadura sediminis]|uniref:Serine/threonine-protein kinase n=1 Tax=Actinomadura sediminis TaxID=1038904 RepID=A0ABW3ERD7_9ACTN
MDQGTWAPGAKALAPGDPESIDGYRILGKLGEGGMGAVYLGLAGSGQKVAIKVVRPEFAGTESFRARFASEVANARRVASFCTARVLEHGETHGMPYLVTEYIEGPSLADYVKAHGAVPAGQLRSIAIGVATALTAIHAVRLVHRDLKPANVLLSATGPRVIDFGIARAIDAGERHTRTGNVVGTPGWVAPEQLFDGQVGTAVDIFTWGTLIAYAATGRHPYGTGNLATLAARAREAGHDLSGVPGELLPLVRAALAPTPAGRPTADAILRHLAGGEDAERAATDIIGREWTAPRVAAPSPETREDVLPGAPAPRRRRRGWLGPAITAAATAVVAGGAGIAVLAAQGDGEHPAEESSAAPSAAATQRRAAVFTRISDPCGTIPPALAAELVPNGRPVPTENVAEGVFGAGGVGTGCGWTSGGQPGSDVQRTRNLVVEFVISPEANGGAARTARDYALGRSTVQGRANTTVGDGSYGPLTSLGGVGDEAFAATSRTRAEDGAVFTGAAAGIRHRNVLIEIRYGGADYTADGKAPLDDSGVPPERMREAAGRVAVAVVNGLNACPQCYNE